jgi:hypothetical protein
MEIPGETCPTISRGPSAASRSTFAAARLPEFGGQRPPAIPRTSAAESEVVEIAGAASPANSGQSVDGNAAPEIAGRPSLENASQKDQKIRRGKGSDPRSSDLLIFLFNAHRALGRS